MKYNPERVLFNNGPLLTSELAQKIWEEHKDVSIAAIKKGIERSYHKDKIKRMEFLTFGKRERLYYTENVDQAELLTKVLATIKERRPIIYRLWRALKKRKSTYSS